MIYYIYDVFAVIIIMASKEFSTIWPITPHTVAKHHILEEYLKAWFPILASWANKLVYIDGFAGPGRYVGGELGSPIIALNTAIKHPMIKPEKTILFGFIERDKKRRDVLCQTLDEEFPSGMPPNIHYEVIASTFESGMNSILNPLDERHQKLAPSFVFVDSFGYSKFSMNLIKRILSQDNCEVLITFMIEPILRFLKNMTRDAMVNLFGTDEWYDEWYDDLKDKKSDEKIEYIVQYYVSKLKDDGSKHICKFKMIGKNNKPLYFLIFATNNIKGLEVMKKAMLKVDKSGLYFFSDRLGEHQTFISDLNDISEIKHAANLIFNHFKGLTVNVSQIYEFTLSNTRYASEKKLLKFLEQRDSPLIQVTNRKKALSYPSGCIVTFVD